MASKKYQISENLRVQMYSSHQQPLAENMFNVHKRSFFKCHNILQILCFLAVFALVGFFAWNRGKFKFKFLTYLNSINFY